jgi:PiT family inorganic phosphate transporter
MGIIWLLLIANGVTTKEHLPNWVVMSCFLAIGIGTMFGGWRIVKTMGQRITKLKPVGGFAAECAGSVTLFMATHFGIPVSPRTPSPAPSSAWARRAVRRPCAGASRAAS